jgi:hypothetical protein
MRDERFSHERLWIRLLEKELNVRWAIGTFDQEDFHENVCTRRRSRGGRDHQRARQSG